ncbi:sigma E protease regulator RseP [Alteromonas oceanisediminis]|uniref:sigma E protease regulator RseP n=1 Tax=Alteromonas oceanisediminis TaxID=2836180 RepID=UPI001BDB112F|nr:sigma E protease regulator RseP [Alteromonas oceanisediminis]MBT0585007.1 sigma E protease regulator RseP [Alteromonas oceanisediminis]
MIDFFWSLGAFIVALGILVAVHEWGHFWVARRCGVHVERFSIGFGKALWRTRDKHGTEFVIAAIPLGGYVRMLDERVDNVPANQAHKAFNRQSVGKRMAIIAAGPGVNFVFAVAALFLMYLIGVQTVKPIVGSVEPQSFSAQAGVQAGDQIIAVGGRETLDWEAVNLEFVSHVGDSELPVTVLRETGHSQQLIVNIAQWRFDPDKASALSSLGITPFRPNATTEIAFIGEESAAARAGIEVGDELLAIDGVEVDSWQSAVELITVKPNQSIEISVLRGNAPMNVNVRLDAVESDNGQRGYLGVSPRVEPWPDGVVFTHQYGIVGGFSQALERTWRLMTLSVEMIGKLITGDVSVKNLSGPISIAQGAGASADYGLVYFLSFLALISVNLGIINLLPLPMLDGGHLMYFTIEWLTGKPVSESVQELGFKIGGVLLFALMSIAIFNDIARLA